MSSKFGCLPRSKSKNKILSKEDNLQNVVDSKTLRHNFLVSSLSLSGFNGNGADVGMIHG
jgi:hypothetical protein